jgi:hypothetical protein
LTSGNGPGYASPASAVATASYIANLNKAAAMSAAAAGHLQQQQQQQQQRAVMQQGTPTEKRSRWMAENYSQNIYAVSHRKTSDNKTKPGAVLIKLYFIHNLQMGPISECLSLAGFSSIFVICG